ncbi:MAG TPA: DMT family transporter [Longimicrobium sp.]|nr:DMT family transporter [Longimicrobium sp.]
MAASSNASAPALAESPLPSSTRLFLYVALSTQTLISAGTYLAAKRAMVELDPLTLIACRFGLSASVFVLILLVTPGLKLPPGRAVKRLLYLGFLAGPLNQGLFFFGLSKSTPAHAALLYALTPISVYLISTFRGHERLSRRALAGILSAFTGVVVLLLGRGLESATGPMFGDLFILGAVVAWAFYTAEGKTFIAEHGPIRSTAWSMTTAALLIVPVAPFVFDTAALANASRTTLWCIAYLALLTSVLSYLLWYFALSKTRASKVAVFSNLQPVATALAAWAVLGDPLRWEIGVGGVLVLAGVRLTQTA